MPNAVQDSAVVLSDIPRTHLRRCVRHIIWKDFETHLGGSALPATALKALLSDEVDSDDTLLKLGEDGVGLDSLAKISSASAIARFFDMGRSGLDDHLLFSETLSDWADIVWEHLRRTPTNSRRIVFETSGSTDAPTLVPWRLTDLEKEVSAFRQCFVGDDTERIVSLVPAKHIFGWQFTIALPTALGCEVLDCVGRGMASAIARLGEGDLIIATPFHWEALLSAGIEFPDGVAGVTSSAPMSDALWSRLTEAGLATLHEVFGATETGGIGWRSSPDLPFNLFPHLCRSGATEVLGPAKKPLELQDHFSWQSDTAFLPGSRLDKAIQIAGTNVSIKNVERVIEECPDVVSVAVRPAGGRLKAFIVPAQMPEDLDALERRIASHVRKFLAPPARPVRYDFGRDLPRNSIGKRTDW